MTHNPFAPQPQPSPAPARWLGESDFAALHAAAEFAAVFHLFFDTTVTISWKLMDVEHDVPRAFASFLKCLGAWLGKRHIPPAWLYVHERGTVVGLHTHVILHLTADYRGDFGAWAKGWPARQVGRRTPRALRVRGPKQETPALHWLTTSYLLKCYDRLAIVQSARTSPDGQAVYLGDLIAWPWHDSGPVPLKRCGVSRSLDAANRALGRPGGRGFEYLLGKDSFPVVAQPRPAFRSAYGEDGIRDVRRLYPAAFYDRITRLPRVPLPEPIESAGN